MNLFDFGLDLGFSEPDLWDLIPDIELRSYDRTYSISENTRRYFACWDFGAPAIYLRCNPFRISTTHYFIPQNKLVVIY